jgi:NAD(P)-dependent dehydrogenase (short-subunit alcohol dehydrogenase family)
MSEDLKGKTAVVTGGSRGFGRGIVAALAARGMRVVVVARNQEHLTRLAREISGNIVPVCADAGDPLVAARIVEVERPNILVLNAGARSIQRPTRFHTWETFSAQLQFDVKSAFTWIREALLLPLEKGSTIFIGSSGAALRPAAINAGYAAAKSALWAFARSVAQEGQELGVRVHCLLPIMTPETETGREALDDFARRLGTSVDQIAESKGMKPFLTPAMVGEAMVRILTDPSHAMTVGFRVTGNGLHAMVDQG